MTTTGIIVHKKYYVILFLIGVATGCIIHEIVDINEEIDDIRSHNREMQELVDTWNASV